MQHAAGPSYTVFPFSCKMDNAAILYALLRTVHFAENVQMNAAAQSLTFTCELNKCLQASLSLRSDLFYEYRVETNFVGHTVAVNFDVLLESLGMFVSSASASALFQSAGAASRSSSTVGMRGNVPGYRNQPMTTSVRSTPSVILAANDDDAQITITEMGAVTECTLHTIAQLDFIDFQAARDAVVCRAMVRCESLRGFFRELDAANSVAHESDSVEFHFRNLAKRSAYANGDDSSAGNANANTDSTQKKAALRVLLRGIAGTSSTALDVDSEFLTSYRFDDSSASATGSYKVKFLKRAVSAFELAQRVMITLYQNGLLRLQFHVSTTVADQQKLAAHVTFFVCADEQADDEFAFPSADDEEGDAA